MGLKITQKSANQYNRIPSEHTLKCFSSKGRDMRAQSWFDVSEKFWFWYIKVRTVSNVIFISRISMEMNAIKSENKFSQKICCRLSICYMEVTFSYSD